MKLLILNRRCIRHSQRGGAEVYTWHLARAVVEKGGKVEWFSSIEKGLPEEETIEGVKFIRKGNELTTHFYGYLHAKNKDRDWLIIDEFNGLGFFTFKMDNSIILIHQLYDEFWAAELGRVGLLFKYLERFLLGLYREKTTITVSKSTKKDLLRFGFKKIFIIHNGLDIIPLKEPPLKEKNLNLVYLGRLKKTKNPEDAIKSFLIIKERIPDAVIHIIGTGPQEKYLKDLYDGKEGIIFHGFLNEEDKYEILRRSHFLLVPSIREGWGQVVIQANAMGTPAIGYNVHGLIDSIKDNETGRLVSNYRDMAQEILELWENKKKYNTMVKNALNWAKNFRWEKTKEDFLSLIERLWH